MVNSIGFKSSIDVYYSDNNNKLRLGVSSYQNNTTISSDIIIKFDPGANVTFIDFEYLNTELGYTSDSIILDGEKYNIKPIICYNAFGREDILLPVILESMVIGDYEIKNLLVFTMSDEITINRDTGDLELAQSISQDSITYLQSIVDSMNYMSVNDIMSVHSVDSSRCDNVGNTRQSRYSLLGMNVLEHFKYCIDLDGIDIEPYEDEYPTDNFRFKSKGKFYLELHPTSRRIFNKRYKDSLLEYNDTSSKKQLIIISIDDMQSIDRKEFKAINF